MPTINQGRVQSDTGTVTFPQPATASAPLNSFALQTPSAGINLFETYSNTQGNVTLGLRSLNVGTGLKLMPNRGVLYLYIDPAFAAGFAPVGSDGLVPWDRLPLEVKSVPFAFILPSKPPSAQVYHLALAIAATIPANLAGTVVYAGQQATSAAQFVLNLISGGVTSQVATLTIQPDSSTDCVFSTQPAISLSAGDVLQLVAPSPGDATLADLGITIYAEKV